MNDPHPDIITPPLVDDGVDDDPDPPRPLLYHLNEVRQRLLWSGGAFLLAFAACYYFVEDIYQFLAAPLAEAMASSEGIKRLIYTGLADAFLVYLKTALFAALMLTMPLILTQIWLFLSPGLLADEKKLMRPFLIASPLLFFAGAALAYYGIMPLAWNFLLSFELPAAANALPIEAEPKLDEYLSLTRQFLFAFGLCFQLPIVLGVLTITGAVTPDWLASKRRYAAVLALIAAAILTPPDIFSQIGLGGAIYILYEGSVWLSRGLYRRKK